MTEPPAVQKLRQLLADPGAAAAEFHAALEKWRREGGDLAAHLGIAPPDGRAYTRGGPHGLRLADRDQAIRGAAALLSGSRMARSRALAALLARRASGDPLNDAPLDLLAQVDAIGPPLSARTLFRVLGGARE